MAQGKEASSTGLIIGWLTSLGILGIVIGYRYAFSKGKSRFSEKLYFKYDEESGKNGAYLFYGVIGLSLLGLLYRIVSE